MCECLAEGISLRRLCSLLGSGFKKNTANTSDLRSRSFAIAKFLLLGSSDIDGLFGIGTAIVSVVGFRYFGSGGIPTPQQLRLRVCSCHGVRLWLHEFRARDVNTSLDDL